MIAHSRTLGEALSDIRLLTCRLCEMPDGNVRPGNQSGVAVPPPEAGVWASLLPVSVHTQGTPSQTREDLDAARVATTEAAILAVACHLQFFRTGATDRAQIFAQLLQTSYGAQMLRSIAIGLVDIGTLDVSSAVFSGLWEERALVKVTFSMVLSLASNSLGINPALSPFQRSLS